MKMWSLKFLVSGALLAALLRWGDTEQVFARLQDAQWGWLAVSLTALVTATLSMARRWQLTARIMGLRIGYVEAVKEYYLAQLVNSVLPGGVLGDVGRAVRMRRHADLLTAGQSVAAERLMGQLAMFSLLGVGLCAALLVPGGIEWPRAIVTLFALVPVLVAVAVWAMRRFLPLQAFGRQVQALLRNRAILFHAALGALLLIFSLYSCARATGSMIPPEGWLTILPLVFCAMLVPLSIAGWGWREGAAAMLFPLAGLTADAGLAMGICYGAMMLISALPALFFMLAPSGLRAAPEQAGPS